MKDIFSLRIFIKLVTILAGFAVLLIAFIWTRASFVWGTDTSLQWAWFIFALIAGVSSLISAVRPVDTRSLLALILVDFILAGVIWWL